MYIYICIYIQGYIWRNNFNQDVQKRPLWEGERKVICIGRSTRRIIQDKETTR